MPNPEAIKQTIAEILGIPNVPDWTVLELARQRRKQFRQTSQRERGLKVPTDTDDLENRDLFMCHYADPTPSFTPDLKTYGDIRGVVVDVKARAVVARSFGYTPTAIVSTITADHTGIVPAITDELGNIHYLNLHTDKFKYGLDGTTVRVMFHGGKVYHMTHKNLNMENSYWGTTPGTQAKTFGQIWQELDGPADTVLFDTTKQYSPYIHFFRMVHPDLLVATRQQVKSGYLAYMGSMTMWQPENAPYPNELIDYQLRKPVTSNVVTGLVEKTYIYESPDMTLKEVNDFLAYGFYQQTEGLDSIMQWDVRISLGEFVRVYRQTALGTEEVLRIASPAYSSRASIVGGKDTNMVCRLAHLSNGSRIPAETEGGLAVYLSKFPQLTRYDLETLRKMAGQMVVWPMDEKLPFCNLDSQQDRLYNIYMCLVAAVPLHRQQSTVETYPQLLKDINAAIRWLQSLKNRSDLDSMRLQNKKPLHVLKQARERALTVYNGPNRRGRSMDALMDESIDHLMNNELYGETVYSVVTAMRNQQKFQAKIAQKFSASTS